MTTPIDYILYISIFLGLYFQIFLLLTYLGWREHKDDLPGFSEEQLPGVSIMVPCWNEATTVQGTIDSLLASNYPRDRLQIVIIDDGSTDNSWDILKQFNNHPQIMLLQKENGGKFTALNYALEYITNPIVGCLDADSAVDPNAIRYSAHWFSRDDVYGVVPSMVVQNPQTIMQHMQKVEYEVATYLKNVLHQLEALYVAPGPLTLFRKEVFDKLGPYVEAHHTEDLEIALRMQVGDMRLAYSEDSLVYTKGPRTWKALLKQRIRWTYGFIKNVQDYRRYLFTKEFGDLSLFILPISIITLFFAVFVFGLMVTTIISGWVQTVQTLLVTGFQFKQPNFSFDVFDIPSTAVSWFSFIGIVLLAIALVIGRRIILKQKEIFTLDILTIIIYPFFSSWWTIRSLWNAFLSKKGTWR
jgi:biofilm PGA synthesis N-glycosyltransferase PgaC